jgi:probable HAF family extracellular repeat protein
MSRNKLAAAAGTLAVGATLAFAGAAHAAVEYSLTLTNPGNEGPNSPLAEAPLFAINNLGVPVGYAFSSINDGQNRFATRGTDLQHLTIGSDLKNRNHETVAFDINDSGTAVGTGQATNLDTELGLGLERPFLWNAGNNIGQALNLFGGKSVEPHAVNNAGDIAGITFPGNGVDGKQDKTTAFVLDHSGTLTTLPTLSGGRFDKAADVNESGVVVGSSDSGTSATQHAVAWRNGAPSELGVLAGGTFSAALKVNATGTAVGISSSATSSQQAVMFAGGQVTNLNFPGLVSKASSINDSGTVVGWTGTNDGNGTAYRYQNGQITSLNSLIAPGSGYTLAIANDINKAGQIVGVARQDAHPEHRVGFILTPIS